MLGLMRKQNPTLHNQDAAPEVPGSDLVDSDIHETSLNWWCVLKEKA